MLFRAPLLQLAGRAAGLVLTVGSACDQCAAVWAEEDRGVAEVAGAEETPCHVCSAHGPGGDGDPPVPTIQ